MAVYTGQSVNTYRYYRGYQIHFDRSIGPRTCHWQKNSKLFLLVVLGAAAIIAMVVFLSCSPPLACVLCRIMGSTNQSTLLVQDNFASARGLLRVGMACARFCIIVSPRALQNFLPKLGASYGGSQALNLLSGSTASSRGRKILYSWASTIF